MQRITVYITEQQKIRIEQLAQEIGVRFAELLRRLLDEALHARQK